MLCEQTKTGEDGVLTEYLRKSNVADSAAPAKIKTAFGLDTHHHWNNRK